MLRAVVLALVPTATWAGAVDKEGMGRSDAGHALCGSREVV